MNRRSFLALLGGGAVVAPRTHAGPEKLPVAGVVTVYQRSSHADVILGKILEGYDQKGGHGPALKLASLYIDQPKSSRLGLGLARKLKIPVFDTIEGAVAGIPVQGVISIGEHGDYPNDPMTGQKLYPRRRFFDEITAAFRKQGRVVPIFNDKHFCPFWSDAKHMYNTAKRMKIPFMAGSSIPVAWREPKLTLKRGSPVKEALAIGYGGPEAYGFHALEGLQCMVERRAGAETGVKSVQAVTGDAIWEAEAKGLWSMDLLTAALRLQPRAKQDRLRERLRAGSPFYLIEYRDGTRGTVAMLSGITGDFGFAARIEGEARPRATFIRLDYTKPFAHFAWLLRGIEHLVHQRRPPYPVERTLLTTGILDRAIHSLVDNGRRLPTPELEVSYQATDWGYADRDFPPVTKS